MKLTFQPHTLFFKHAFSIAHGTRVSTPVVFVEIEHDGVIGYGEASMPPYLGEDHQSVVNFLSKARQVLSNHKDPFNLDLILNEIDKIEEYNTAAKASLDIALHDLVGKLKNKSWYSIWNLDKEKAPHTFYTIGIDTSARLQQKVKEGQAYKMLKVKLGSKDDSAIIKAIRSFTDKPMSVDVNQGWKDKHYALEMIHMLNENDVMFVEQPLPKENMADAAWLNERSPLPIIADESVQRLADIEKIHGAFAGINIKLMKCTGMNEAYRMIQRARELNMKILIGCMSETSCAVSAAAQLSPLVDWADLDGPLLIKEDFFEGVMFSEGKIVLNDLPGIGVRRVG